MISDPAALQNLLVFAAAQFAVGCLGLLSRRSLFQILLSGLVMLQAVSLAIAAVNSAYADAGGAAWLLLLWGMAAALLMFAATLLMILSRRRNSPDVAGWRSLRESERDPLDNRSLKT